MLSPFTWRVPEATFYTRVLGGDGQAPQRPCHPLSRMGGAPPPASMLSVTLRIACGRCARLPPGGKPSLSICTAEMRAISTSWRLLPSRSKNLQQTQGVHTGPFQARARGTAAGAQRHPAAPCPYLWLLERRHTIVSGFSEWPKVTRKVAPWDADPDVRTRQLGEEGWRQSGQTGLTGAGQGPAGAAGGPSRPPGPLPAAGPGRLPLRSTLSCLSKNSASRCDTRAHSAHCRTGSTKHMRRSATFWLQHLSQKHFPHRRQWCWRGHTVGSEDPRGPTPPPRPAPPPPAHLPGEEVKLGATLHAPRALGGKAMQRQGPKRKAPRPAARLSLRCGKAAPGRASHLGRRQGASPGSRHPDHVTQGDLAGPQPALARSSLTGFTPAWAGGSEEIQRCQSPPGPAGLRHSPVPSHAEASGRSP